MEKRIIETPSLLFRRGEHVWNTKKPDHEEMQILEAKITECRIMYTVARTYLEDPWNDIHLEEWNENDIERVENKIPRFHIGEFIYKKSNPALIAQIKGLVVSGPCITYDVHDKSMQEDEDEWHEEDVESAEERLSALFKEGREE